MTDYKLGILLIDDNPEDRELISWLLSDQSERPVRITEAESGEIALMRLREANFDCVLLDFSMPGNDGLAVLQEIRLRYSDMPVVMMTGEGSERVAVTALKGGAQDYVLKADLTASALVGAIDSALAAKRAESEIIHRANYDELTGLANRRMFNDRLDHALSRTGASINVAVIFFDLDGFKAVNDTHGHDCGDAILKQVAERLLGSLRSGDTVARLGGDEFVVLLENLPGDDRGTVEIIGDRLAGGIRDEPFVVVDRKISIGASTGLALYPLMADNRSDLLRVADQEMYRMKRGEPPARMPANEALRGRPGGGGPSPGNGVTGFDRPR